MLINNLDNSASFALILNVRKRSESNCKLACEHDLLRLYHTPSMNVSQTLENNDHSLLESEIAVCILAFNVFTS